MNHALVVLCFALITMPLMWGNNSGQGQAPTSLQQEIANLADQPAVHAAGTWFTAHSGEISDWQMAITRIPSPPFGESHRAEWLRQRFAELGLEEVHIDGAGNVLGISPGTTPGAKFVAVSAHMDTVFPAGTPIDVRRDGDRLLGPGISDNGAGLTALLAIATVLHENGIRHAAPILFVTTVGEEGEGDLRGMRYLFSDPRWREGIAYTIVVDGGGMDTVVTEGLGARRFQAVIRGPGGHSWSDFGTPNPIVLLARAIANFSRTPIPSDPRTAFNIGVINGGTSVNAIPESASMRVDMRSASPAELDRLEHALRDALAHAVADVNTGGNTRRGHEVTYTLKQIGNRPSAQLAPDARILQVVKAIDDQLGIDSRQQRASTDANIPLSQGREAVAIGGGGSGGGAHTVHEWYDPAGRELGLRRILLILLALSGLQ